MSPHPKRKSVSRSNDQIQALPLIEEIPIGDTGYAYEDPPPPSPLNVYRSSQSTDDDRKIPRKTHPHGSPPSPGFLHRSVKPKADPPAQLGRSDSLLNRVFTYLESDARATNTDLDRGTESQPSRPSSLWRAGSANVVSKHVPQRSSVTQADISNGVDLQPMTPVRGDVAGTGGAPGQHEETLVHPPDRSHIRDIADYPASPPRTPPPQQLPPIASHPLVHCDSPVDSPLPLHPPGIPEPNAGQDLSFPLPPLQAEFETQSRGPERGEDTDPTTTYPSPMPHPRLRSPPQQDSVVGPNLPSSLKRSRRVSRNEVLLRPFPDPIHNPPPSMGPTRFTPPRGKLTIPAPLAQPLPRGSGSLKRNRMNTLPAPEKPISAGEEPYQEPCLRRHSQPIPVPRHMTDPNHAPCPPNRQSRDPNRRTSQPLPVLRETNQLHMSPPSSPLQRSSRRLPSPPMSGLPRNRPTRSNAVYRKSLGSPTRATSSRTSLLAELRSAPPMESDDFSRYPMSGFGSGTGSPPRNNRTRSSLSPRTPPFINTHLLPSPMNSPGNSTGSDMEE